jgi:hypothetical protein
MKFYESLKARGVLKKDQTIPNVDAFALYTEAFVELNTCRPQGFGPAPIPFLAILEYAKLYEIEDTEEFIYIIRTMDNAYMSKQEKPKDVNKTSSKTDNNRSSGQNGRKPRKNR